MGDEWTALQRVDDRSGFGRAEARPKEEVLAEIERQAEEGLRALSSIPAWSPQPVRGVLESHFSYTRPEHAGRK